VTCDVDSAAISTGTERVIEDWSARDKKSVGAHHIFLRRDRSERGEKLRVKAESLSFKNNLRIALCLGKVFAVCFFSDFEREKKRRQKITMAQ
jgi:hypothetical protein